MKAKLKIFTNDIEWYVATDIEHVNKIMFSMIGETLGSLDEEDSWYALPDDAMLSISYEKRDFSENSEKLPRVCSMDFSGEMVKVKAAVKEWIKISSPGFLCSTEW